METNAISTSHIEAKQTTLKRVVVYGKKLFRELNGQSLIREEKGKKIDESFTLLKARDVSTGEELRSGICIPTSTAESRSLSHLIINPNDYPNNKGNINIDFTGDKAHLKQEYDVALLWIPENAEYQDKEGNWKPYRKTNCWLMTSALEPMDEDYKKQKSAMNAFQFMTGRAYDGKNADVEDRKLFIELIRSF